MNVKRATTKSRWIQALMGGALAGVLAVVSAVPASAQAPAATGAQGVMDLENVFESVAQRIDPAVVHIEAQITEPEAGNDAQAPDQVFPFGPGQGFPFGPPGGGGGGGRPRPRSGLASGSGVILQPDGIIVTNRHVVEGATRVTVTLIDHRIFSGTVYSDPEVDLAVVKVDATGLPTVPLADTSKLKIGQWAIAVGYPFDVGETVSVGIVSALSRSQTIEEHFYPNLIQTDASINPGNSGGALVDIHGNLIGINTAIAGPTAQSAGIGFAIPADAVRVVVPQLAAAPHRIINYPPGWRRGKLGVQVRPITPDLFKVLGVTQGALVAQVVHDSVADRAGVQAGDVITKVNDTPVRDATELVDVISDLGPNQKAVLTLVRNRETITRTVVTASFTDTPTPTRTENRQRLGLTVESVTADNRGELKLPDNVHDGAVVTTVQNGSPADAAGFMQGDVIYQVNDTPVHTAADFNNATANAHPGDSLGIKVYSAGTTAYRVLQVPDTEH